jgi:hypothetical protein
VKTSSPLATVKTSSPLATAWRSQRRGDKAADQGCSSQTQPDASGKSLAGDFDGQVREVFARLGQTLEQAGGALADLVTMTVFITDARSGDRFIFRRVR